MNNDNPQSLSDERVMPQQPNTHPFLDPNLKDRVIPEESSKENSSESSTNSSYKEKLVKEIQKNTLGEILKVRMKQETY